MSKEPRCRYIHCKKLPDYLDNYHFTCSLYNIEVSLAQGVLLSKSSLLRYVSLRGLLFQGYS